MNEIQQIVNNTMDQLKEIAESHEFTNDDYLDFYTELKEVINTALEVKIERAKINRRNGDEFNRIG